MTCLFAYLSRLPWIFPGASLILQYCETGRCKTWGFAPYHFMDDYRLQFRWCMGNPLRLQAAQNFYLMYFAERQHIMRSFEFELEFLPMIEIHNKNSIFPAALLILAIFPHNYHMVLATHFVFCGVFLNPK